MRCVAGLSGVATAVVLAMGAAVPAATAWVASAAVLPSTLYVDSGLTCSDSGPGSAAVPFCTIQKAADVVQPGQTILVKGTGQPDPGPVRMTRSGTPSRPITFDWSPQASQWAPGITATGTKSALTLDNVHDVRIAHLSIGTQGTSDGIDVADSQDITIDQVFVQLAGAADAAAIRINGGSQGITVSHSAIQGNTSGYGVAAMPGSSDVTVTTNAIFMQQGTGIWLDAVAGADVTSNSVATGCGSALDLTGGAASAENNVLGSGGPGGLNCTSQASALTVTGGNITADYNALAASSPAVEYSWNGVSYASAAMFNARTGQGAHDADVASFTYVDAQGVIPPPQAVDSANCAAAGELATDRLLNPHVPDPTVTQTGNGKCHADRGAVELQDGMPFTYGLSTSNWGTVPLALAVTITPGGAGVQEGPSWGLPVSYAVDFGDGTPSVPAQPGTAVAHTYRAPGKYWLTIKATDTVGSVQTERIIVAAVPQATSRLTISAAPAVTGPASHPRDLADTTELHVRDGSSDGWELFYGTVSFGDGATRSLYLPGAGDGVTHTYSRAGTYRVTLAGTDQLDRRVAASGLVTVGDQVAAGARTLDYSRPVPAHGIVRLPMAALRVNPSTTDAVDLQVTVASSRKPGYLTVYPNGAERPHATLLFAAGRDASNSVTVRPGANGLIDFYNGSGGPVRLTVHTIGMATNGSASTDVFVPVRPTRILRATRVGADGARGLAIASARGVPRDAAAVLLGVSVSGTRAGGYLTVYRQGSGSPGIRFADWAAGQRVTSLVTVPLAAAKVVLRNASKGSATFTADLLGYYERGTTGSLYLPLPADRLLVVTIAPGHAAKVRVSGRDGLPANGVTAAAMNLTASGASRGGTVTGWADGTARPGTTSLSYNDGIAAATAALVPVGTDGSIDLYNAGASPVTVAIDLLGAFYR